MSDETQADVMSGSLLWAVTLAYEDRKRAEQGHEQQVRRLTARVDVLRAEADAQRNAHKLAAAERDAARAEADEMRPVVVAAKQTAVLVNKLAVLAHEHGANGSESLALDAFFANRLNKLTAQRDNGRAERDHLRAELAAMKLGGQALIAENNALRAAQSVGWVKIGDLYHAHPDGRFAGWFEVQGRTMTIDHESSKWHDAEPVEAARERGWHDFPGVAVPQADPQNTGSAT